MSAKIYLLIWLNHFIFSVVSKVSSLELIVTNINPAKTKIVPKHQSTDVASSKNKKPNSAFNK